MHKDFCESERVLVEVEARFVARDLHEKRQSLALAREAWINAFDKAAGELSRKPALYRLQQLGEEADHTEAKQ